MRPLMVHIETDSNCRHGKYFNVFDGKEGAKARECMVLTDRSSAHLKNADVIVGDFVGDLSSTADVDPAKSHVWYVLPLSQVTLAIKADLVEQHKHRITIWAEPANTQSIRDMLFDILRDRERIEQEVRDKERCTFNKQLEEMRAVIIEKDRQLRAFEENQLARSLGT